MGSDDFPGADISFDRQELIIQDPVENGGVALFAFVYRNADVLAGIPESV